MYSLKSEGEWRDLIYHGALNNPGVVLWVRNCSEVCFPPTPCVPTSSLHVIHRSMFIALAATLAPWQLVDHTLKVCLHVRCLLCEHLNISLQDFRSTPPPCTDSSALARCVSRTASIRSRPLSHFLSRFLYHFLQFQFEPDNDWNFVYEEWQGNTTLSQHCERPVLFARTEC